MFNSNRGKKLIIALIILIIIILVIIGIVVYNIFKDNNKEENKKDSEDEKKVITIDLNNTTDENTVDSNLELKINNTTNTESKRQFLEGYEILATMRIPAIDLKYEILSEVTKKSLETSIALLYTTGGLNKVGNTVIVGHNYRNDKFFSRNDELQIGDAIFIKDTSGEEVKYIIYDKFETTASDASFYKRDTHGKREVTLSTCTDDASETDGRLILLAREE